MAEIIDIALLILNQSTLEVEYKYFFNWMLQRRNEKGQLPKQIPGTFCFLCEWYCHRDVLLQTIYNLCTAAWYFVISNFNETTSVCNLNLSCSLGARERDYLTVILCYSWMTSQVFRRRHFQMAFQLEIICFLYKALVQADMLAE